MNTAEYIEKYSVICICRKLYGDELLNLAKALSNGGVKLIEVTFDQSDPDGASKTAEAIAALREAFEGTMKIGAGTVLTKQQVDIAKSAGAEYIISPNTDAEVIRYTKENGLVSIPGAMTPTEILTAHHSGADFIKLFPATWLGFPYIKDIIAPLSHVSLIATGGVNEENLKDYYNLGFSGAGISSRLSNSKLIQEGNFSEITERSKNFMTIVNSRTNVG